MIARNKLAFVARVHERRLREIEKKLGIPSPPNPLFNTYPSDCMEAVESPKESTAHGTTRSTAR